MNTPRLLSPNQYYENLLLAVRHARRRIAFSAMIGLWDDVTQPLFETALQAAQRGVDVHIMFDRFGMGPLGEGLNLTPSFWRRRAATLNAFERLKTAGVRVSLTGTFKSLNPYKGRYHAKIFVADTTYFSFGGINFSQNSFLSKDYMLSGDDAIVSDVLWELLDRQATDSISEDLRLPLDDDNAILFDSGIAGRSIIYETACELLQQSKKAIYVSQMAPSNVLAVALRKIPYEAYFNRPSQPPFPDSLGLFIDQHRYGIQNKYTGKDYIHAKFILFDLKDGGKAVISGSNNFSWRGVAYGTEEIALLSHDAKVYAQLAHFAAQLTRSA